MKTGNLLTVGTPRTGWRFASRVLARLEYWVIGLLGRTLGISVVVRYLRNPNPSISSRLLRAFGAEVGEGTTIKGGVIIDNVLGDANATGDLSHLMVGKNCYIGDCVFFDLAGKIVVADGSVVAARAAFLTHAECKRSSYLSECFPRMCAPISVEAGAWIGFGATILAGVTVGENSVVGANALVTRNTEPYFVYVGSPARKVRRVDGTASTKVSRRSLG